MSRRINIWRDPYGEGFNTCRARSVEFNPGLTVLVGCNGAGKTTMLENIRSELKDKHIPFMYFDNLKDGGHGSISDHMFHENYGAVSMLMSASEGESIGLNVGNFLYRVRSFLKTGEDPKRNPFQDALDGLSGRERKPTTSKERWVFLDAVDSGYSVDNVIDLKEVFGFMNRDAEVAGVELYIIATANEYELARGSTCLNVTSGKYVIFKDYEDYRKCILKTRKTKDKRYDG